MKVERNPRTWQTPRADPSVPCQPCCQCQVQWSDGRAQRPYPIATPADLIALGETPGDYDKCFLLTADIDLDPHLVG